MKTETWAGALVVGKGFAVFQGPGAPAARHRHDAVQIIACAATPVTVAFDSDDMTGHVIVVPSRLPHRIVEAGAQVVVALVEPAVFGSYSDQTAKQITISGNTKVLESIVGSSDDQLDPAAVLEHGAQLIEFAGGRHPAKLGNDLRPEVVRAVELIELKDHGVPRRRRHSCITGIGRRVRAM